MFAFKYIQVYCCEVKTKWLQTKAAQILAQKESLLISLT